MRDMSKCTLPGIHDLSRVPACHGSLSGDQTNDATSRWRLRQRSRAIGAKKIDRGLAQNDPFAMQSQCHHRVRVYVHVCMCACVCARACVRVAFLAMSPLSKHPAPSTPACLGGLVTRSSRLPGGSPASILASTLTQGKREDGGEQEAGIWPV